MILNRWRKKKFPLEINVPKVIEEIGWSEFEKSQFNQFIQGEVGSKFKATLERQVLESAFRTTKTSEFDDGVRAGIAYTLVTIQLMAGTNDSDSPSE